MTRRKDVTVSLTEARTRLFRIVEELLAGRTDRIALSHRGHDERVLLVRASEVERMEAELAALRRRSAVFEPRPLWGIATLVGDPETVLDEIRVEANRQREKRMRELFDDPPPAVADEAKPEVTDERARRPRSRGRKTAS